MSDDLGLESGLFDEAPRAVCHVIEEELRAMPLGERVERLLRLNADASASRPGYDPTRHPKATICGEKKPCCWRDGEPHVIVPEGFYVPPVDIELYQLVSGKEVEIVLGAAIDHPEVEE